MPLFSKYKNSISHRNFLDTKEEIDLITERLKICLGTTTGFVVGCISSVSQEGTSFAVEQIGKSLLKFHNRVLLVDANPNRNLSSHFGLVNRRGLTDIALAGKEGEIATDTLKNMIHFEVTKRLHIIPGGLSSGEIKSSLWESIIQSLRAEWPATIIDLPPIMTSMTGPKVSHLLDGLILVIRAHSTRKEILLAAKRELERTSNAKILGTILNGRKYFIPEFLYRFL